MGRFHKLNCTAFSRKTLENQCNNENLEPQIPSYFPLTVMLGMIMMIYYISHQMSTTPSQIINITKMLISY